MRFSTTVANLKNLPPSEASEDESSQLPFSIRPSRAPKVPRIRSTAVVTIRPTTPLSRRARRRPLRRPLGLRCLTAIGSLALVFAATQALSQPAAPPAAPPGAPTAAAPGATPAPSAAAPTPPAGATPDGPAGPTTDGKRSLPTTGAGRNRPKPLDPPTPDQLLALKELEKEAKRYERDAKAYRKTLTRIIRHHYEEKRRRLMSALDRELKIETKGLRDARAEAIVRLEKFVAKYSDDKAHPKNTPDAMFRLAALYEERERERVGEIEVAPGDQPPRPRFARRHRALQAHRDRVPAL